VPSLVLSGLSASRRRNKLAGNTYWCHARQRWIASYDDTHCRGVAVGSASRFLLVTDCQRMPRGATRCHAMPRSTERLGGTIPRGILFHGAPGIGKTAMDKALALECKWNYLELAGPALLAD
jgi:hypothetical protein